MALQRDSQKQLGHIWSDQSAITELETKVIFSAAVNAKTLLALNTANETVDIRPQTKSMSQKDASIHENASELFGPEMATMASVKIHRHRVAPAAMRGQSATKPEQRFASPPSEQP